MLLSIASLYDNPMPKKVKNYPITVKTLCIDAENH